ncbi:hypothetical protein KIN20_036652 [Parelaphostrongylus tenuis]|uniref:Uncharacterized protein n=1 Tax=Parelaphostrongylus tenuis TaxID=148309 RepID=A0AAD5WKL6_PARTN|nr:hypothetical protein KIN20_036652 [Parelaphostrongylus tenuis]
MDEPNMLKCLVDDAEYYIDWKISEPAMCLHFIYVASETLDGRLLIMWWLRRRPRCRSVGQPQASICFNVFRSSVQLADSGQAVIHPSMVGWHCTCGGVSGGGGGGGPISVLPIDLAILLVQLLYFWWLL